MFSRFKKNPTIDYDAVEIRCTDPRKISRVEFRGKKYIDITELFLESFPNGEEFEGIPSRKRIFSERGNTYENKQN